MAVANVLGKLKSNPYGLDNLLLYGKVRCLIEKPNFIKSLKAAVTTGSFAILDVFAIKCLKLDYFTDKGFVNNSDKTFWSKGSVLFYLDKPELVGKLVKVGGKSLTNGVKLKQQRGCSESSGICAFVFYKDPITGGWLVNPNSVAEMGINKDNFKIDSMSEFAMKAMYAQGTLYENIDCPEELDSYVPYSAIDGDYVEVNPDSVESNSSSFHKTEGRIDLTKVDLKLTRRDSCIELNDLYYAVKDEISAQSEKRANYVRELVLENGKNYTDNLSQYNSAKKKIIENFTYKVAYNYADKIPGSSLTGRFYLEELFKCFTYDAFTEKVEDEELEELKSKVLADPSILLDDKTGYKGIDQDDVLLSMIVGISTSTGYYGLVKNFKAASRLDNSLTRDMWLYMILSNPYKASLMGGGISMVEADAIFFSYSKVLFPETNSDALSIRDKISLLKGIESCCVRDSLVSDFMLKDKSTNEKYTNNRMINSHGFIIKKDLYCLLCVLLDQDVALSTNDRKLLVKSWYSKSNLNYLIERGLIDEVEDKYMLEKDLEKEFLIFEVFQEMGSKETGITEEDCVNAMTKFEDKVGFKLESLQRDGVRLLKHCAAVLSGCAGSGKTTTSDAMKICLEDSLPQYKLIYCAPTGKASRRMAEVVEGTVKTVHSQFKIGVGMNESYLTPVRRKYKSEKGDNGAICYLIDEAGMLNRDLLYEIARSVNTNDLVYFLGDIKQLPPIGVGVPFYTLMNILPCIELGVSKRAAEGSLINYNTTLINCLSDSVVEELMFDDSSFILKECADVAIQETIVKSWKDFMSGAIGGKKYEEKDIQVISGYATSKYLYSSTNINPAIQKLLRKRDKLMFRTNRGSYTQDFYMNDRVIHINSNLYGTPRFVETGKCYFEEVASIGLINGETGVIVGCYASENCEIKEFNNEDVVIGEGFYSNINEEQYKDLLDTRETYEERLVDMNEFKGNNMYFVVVKVYDVSLKRDVVVLYPARGSSVDSVLNLSSGYSIDNLDLAYALTCHKMQGSQTPVAIIPVGSDANPDFINRNMLNTMITRSQEVVELVGSISGEDSPFTKGRRIPSKYKTECLLNYLCGVM